jgi:hypothetical protein
MQLLYVILYQENASLLKWVATMSTAHLLYYSRESFFTFMMVERVHK